VTGLPRSPVRRGALRPSPDFIESSGLGGQFRAGRFHCSHVHIQQSVALVALLFILLPQLDDFLKNFDIKTLSPTSEKTSFFDSFNSCNSVSKCSIRSTKERIRPPGMLMSDMVPLC